jgi:hypothetical protein
MPRTLAWFTGIAAGFLALTWAGLWYYFNPDEISGMYRAWTLYSPWEVLRANLLFFGSENRPLGIASFKLVHALAGFRPVPYHAVCLAICVVNLALEYSLLRSLLKQPFAAELGLALGAFHAAMWSAYSSAGVIYDLLCQTFLLAAMLTYVIAPRRIVLLAAFAILAENAKEMAAALPLVLLAYELLFPSGERGRARWRRLIVVAAAVALATVGHAIFDPVAHMGAYRPVFTLSRLLENVQAAGSSLVMRTVTLPSLVWILIWAALVALAWRLKSRAAFFGGLFFAAAFLPLAFSPPRYDGYVLYIPYIGCAIYFGGKCELALARISSDEWRREFIAAAALLVVALQIGERVYLRDRFGPGGQELIKTLVDDVSQACPTLPAGGKVLLVKDAWGDDQNEALMILRLLYHDPTLEVQKVKSAPTDNSTYVRTFVFNGQGYK